MPFSLQSGLRESRLGLRLFRRRFHSGGSSGGNNGEEEIIIPLGGEVDFGGPQGGGFSIPLDPAMMAPQMGGGGQGSMGFEETEEIGPDGKPHIISEHSFGGPQKSVGKGKPLTAAQKKQQKAMQKQMEGMAKDMAHMFDDGSFFGGVRPGQGKKDRMYQRDLFKNAVKAFDQADHMQMQPMIKNGNSWGGQARFQKKGSKGWQEKMSGKGDIINQAGIVIASCVILGAIVLVGFRYYKTKVQYQPVSASRVDNGIESEPFRSL